jgi:hypothetical protein
MICSFEFEVHCLLLFRRLRQEEGQQPVIRNVEVLDQDRVWLTRA